MAIILFFVFAFFVATSNAGSLNTAQQCASFSDAGVNGYFAMYNPNSGQAYYNFNVDTSLFASQCSTASTSGYIYHIHTSWTNITTMASIGGTYCGKPYTGVHYDPSLACSPNSQYTVNSCIPSSTTPCCTQMGRFSPNYAYTCSPSTYNAGNYSTCEYGDLSGKFGAVFPNSTGFVSSAVLVDKLPYFNTNYLANTQNAAMFASIVFHCESTGARVLCAKLSPKALDLQPCSSAFTSIESFINMNDPYEVDDYLVLTNDDDQNMITAGHSTMDFDNGVYATFFVTLVISFGIGIAIHQRCWTPKEALSKDAK